MLLYYQNIITNMVKVGRKTSVTKDIRGYIIDAHNKGYSVRDVERYLKEVKDINISKTTVQRVISSYKESNRKIDENDSIEEGKPVPVQNISTGKKMNENYQTKVVKKVKPAITGRSYTDYMEALENTNIIKELRVRYLTTARKNSMSFKQYVQNACELERKYLDKEVAIAGGKTFTQPDMDQVLNMAILAKVVKRL